ncbi:hypothetical protein PRZ48_002232 [Zasmidium cellare]|uniref:DUF7514 domain-containing protein n=1 Tax=Zasmidium cellare TaxID=395010 RepID=A0ABR0F6B0_ZASCE|nr:hypothetical protein PRZ48_002232 [Zasmidium cellare]
MGDSPSPPLPPDPTSSNISNNSASTPTARSFQHGSEDARSQDSKRPNTSRSRAASRPSPVVHQTQPTPIKDAVNDAFETAPTSNRLDPDFMKRLTEQVTEQVIKNLQGVNLGGPAPTTSVPLPPGQYPGPPSNKSSSRSPIQRSPLQSSTDSFPPRFTPPSPLQERDLRDRRFSPSPERAPSDAGSNISRESRESEASQRSTQSNRETTPRASQPDVVPGLRRSKTTAGGIPEPMAKPETPSRRRGSGTDASSIRKDSKHSTSSYFESSRTRSRPDVVDEEDTDEEATTLEKIWQPLFDNGNPTVRLSQFLRGIAKHIIDDYEPKGSLVITPAKMLRFLDETNVPDEHYPWATIFGGKMSWNSISMMYRKLLCQHHFVQQQNHDPPSIPALSPFGFEAFMTCMIQAHPDTEFERLAKAVRDMPISNADDCKERFPKELSRRLLPATPNVQAEQRIISSLNHEPVLVPLERGASAMPPPPSSAPPQQSSFQERERAPYSQSSHSNAVEDDDLTAPSMPLERERKPYYAKEGKGKRYDPESEYASRERDAERDSNSAASREPSRPAANKYRPDFASARTSRQNSGVPPQAMFNKGGSTDPMNIPPPNTRSRMSTGPPPPPPGNGSYPKGQRRSPPPRGFARSEPVDVGNIPSSQYASNLHGPAPQRDRYAGDPDEDALRYNAPRRPTERYTNDEEPSGRPIPPRNGPAGPSGYDSGYGSAGGPPPMNNFGPPRNGGQPGPPEDRRRSWYPGVGGVSSGTDGYGSYAGNGGGYGTSGY